MPKKVYRVTSYKKLEVQEGQRSTDLNPKVGMLSIGPIKKLLLVNISLEKKADTKSEAYWQKWNLSLDFE